MDHASLMSALEHIRASLERGSVEEALALVDELSARYFLAPKSIQRILTLGRRGLLEP